MIQVPLDTIVTLEPGIAYTVVVFNDRDLGGPVASVRHWQLGDEEPLTVERVTVASFVTLKELPEGIPDL